jgi:conjugal transfer/type IV secretion protein DotA/TraY
MKKLVLVLIFTIFMSSTTTPGFAANFLFPGITPAANDTAVCIMYDLLGQQTMADVIAKPATCPQYGTVAQHFAFSQALGSVFKVINLIAFVLVSLIVGFWGISSVLAGAVTGNVGHKIINAGWAPVRATIGTSMLIPTTSGFSAIQLAVLYLVMNAWAGASYAWNMGAQALSNSRLTGVPAIVMPNIIALEKRIGAMESCRVYFDTQSQLMQSQGSGQAPMVTIKPKWYGGGTSSSGDVLDVPTLSYDRVDGNGNVLNPGYCGTIRVSLLYNSSSGTGASQNDSLSQFSEELSTATVNANKSAIDGMRHTLEPIISQAANIALNTRAIIAGPGATLTPQDAMNAVTNGQSDLQQFYAENKDEPVLIAQQYQTQLQDALQPSMNMSSNQQALLKASTPKGWFNAGDYLENVTKLVESLNAAFASTPATNVPKIDAATMGATTSADLAKVTGFVELWISASVNGEITDNRQNLAPGSVLKDLKGLEFTKALQQFFLNSVNNNGDQDPLVLLPAIGSFLEGTGFNMLVEHQGFVGKMAAGFHAAFNGTPKAGAEAATGLLAEMGLPDGLVYPVAFGLIAAGMFLTVIIPMFPAALWAFFSFASIISLLMLVSAAPIWAVGHAIPEGEGFAGAYGHRGYMVLLGVAVKPLLGVAGMFLALGLLSEFGGIIIDHFKNISNNAVGTGIEGIPTITMEFLFWVVAYWLLMWKCLELITHGADYALRLIGGGAESGGEHEFASKVQAGFLSIKNNIGTALSRGKGGNKGGGGSEKTKGTSSGSETLEKVAKNIDDTAGKGQGGGQGEKEPSFMDEVKKEVKNDWHDLNNIDWKNLFKN